MFPLPQEMWRENTSIIENCSEGTEKLEKRFKGWESQQHVAKSVPCMQLLPTHRVSNVLCWLSLDEESSI